jgi:hypothetical protein
MVLSQNDGDLGVGQQFYPVCVAISMLWKTCFSEVSSYILANCARNLLMPVTDVYCKGIIAAVDVYV